MGITFPGESREYRAARNQLLDKEIALRRAMEDVAAARRALPPGGLVPQDYVFDGLDHDGTPNKLKLSELFAPGKDTLIIYNFMFPRFPTDSRRGPVCGATAHLQLKETPCPSCTAFLDGLDGAAKHIEAAGFNFVVVANAPLAHLIAFAKERGWRGLRLLSSASSTFKRDYHAETPDGQLPLMTVFHRSKDGIRHFWSSEMTYAQPDPGQDPRQNGTIEMIWNLMDLTPEGRPSDWHEQIHYDCRIQPLPFRA